MRHDAYLSWRALPKAPTLFLTFSVLLMVATVVFSNVLCWGGCNLLSLKYWHWVAPLKLSGLLVVAAGLLMVRHPLSYVGAILISSYAIYDVGFGVYEEWRRYSTIPGLQGLRLWGVVLRESLFPVWRGLIRVVLGTLFVVYGSMRLFRNAQAIVSHCPDA